MARTIYGNLDLAGNQLLNVRLQVLPTAPSSPTEGMIYYNSTSDQIQYYALDPAPGWVTLGAAGAGSPPSGLASGDLTGSYPGPQVAALAITDAKVAVANKDGAAATPSMRTLGTGAAQAAAGNDARFTDSRPPNGAAGGDLAGTYPNPTIKPDVIVDADINSAAAIAQSKIAGLAASFTAKQDTSAKGVANGYAPLDAGNLIPTVHIPPLALSEVFVVASQAAMLALTAQPGDMAIRTDTGQTFVLSVAPASTLGNWKEIMAVGQVVSVNGSTGVVSITLASLGGVPTSRSVIAGAGLTGGGALTADATLNVVGGATLSVTADSVDVVSAPKWTTPRSVTLTGDITGTTPSVDGSGNVSIATTLAAGAGGKRFAQTLGTSSPQVITHNLNTRDVIVQVYNALYEHIDLEVEATTVNTVTLRHNPALPVGCRVVILA